MRKSILLLIALLTLTVSCSNDDNNNDNSTLVKLDNTAWSGVFSSTEIKIMTNNTMNWDNEKVQVQFKENNSFKLYGYGKNSQNQWIINSGPYNGTYTYSSTGTIKLNYESGATFSPLNNGTISGSVMTLNVGSNQFKFTKE
ncbi:hypothetical protein [Chryseobacterium sp. Bi04]|uniref:hypothetical protein n=1 Tax=Chryseobacterium sp. Bi04 TaxID=2822345 RepID=UPI001DBE1353|nr:hypothetical protein [Chryseobacterium sp. Bi04]CAH0255666.1 hypothetical protein SRABI04_03348 [Chryseobacterium sp. Bi04]